MLLHCAPFGSCSVLCSWIKYEFGILHFVHDQKHHRNSIPERRIGYCSILHYLSIKLRVVNNIRFLLSMSVIAVALIGQKPFFEGGGGFNSANSNQFGCCFIIGNNKPTTYVNNFNILHPTHVWLTILVRNVMQTNNKRNTYHFAGSKQRNYIGTNLKNQKKKERERRIHETKWINE